MPFLEQLADLCKEKLPTDVIMQPGANVAYFQNDQIHQTDLRFDEGDVPQFLQTAGMGDWTADSNKALVVGGHRLRANFFHSLDARKVVMRRLPNAIPTVTELGIPQQFVDMVTNASSGLALVCGPMGSGKSTTLASVVQNRLSKRDDHCVTIENPVEYILKGTYPLQVSQREIGKCVSSYAVGLKSALRQRAKTILVQEIIDPESAITAISAAMTGHFVLGTLHTGRVGLSVERLLELIPSERMQSFANILSQVLRGVMCQRLIKRSNGKGVFALHEVMMSSTAISTLISKQSFKSIEGELDTGSSFGHQSFKQSLKMALGRNDISQADKQVIESTL